MELTKTVKLNKGNLFWHYSIVPFLLIVPILSIWNLLKYHVFNNYDGVKTPEFAAFEFICVVLAILAYIVQFKSLRFKEIRIAVDNDKFNIAVHETAKELEWKIDFHSDNFVRAHRNWNWTASWGEMITIIRHENLILINSICDPNAFRPSITSWGWNRKNVQTFTNRLKKAST